MQTLGVEYNAGTILFIIVCVCLFAIILTISFVFISELLINRSLQKEEEKIIEERAELKDRELITQAKTHHRNYPEDFAKKLKEKHDFKVDFSVNTENSIVRTEVVYAE